METVENLCSSREATPEVFLYSHVRGGDHFSTLHQWSEIQFLSPGGGKETEASPIQGISDKPQSKKARRAHSISISMPCSPLEDHLPCFKQEPFSDYGGRIPIPRRCGNRNSSYLRNAVFQEKSRIGRLAAMTETKFDSFKTWSGKLKQQCSNLSGKPQETKPEDSTMQNTEKETIPVKRYFDALQGPELDSLKASEEIALPQDEKWPFLLRFPISSFGICLGISSQAIMWKAIATSPSMKFLHIDLSMNLLTWLLSLALVVFVSVMYILKVIFYLEAVRREYDHPIRVNFFFAPWISLLLLVLGAPPRIAKDISTNIWYLLMAPIFCLEIKIYGQWMLGGQRRLSRVANPSNHLAVIGNFVGALLGASMDLKEWPLFFFAVGMAHYGVLFVTLYQRLPTNETLPKELHPVFFLFIAAPSVASMALAKIQGSFDLSSRIAYFIALFLYVTLVVRVNFFRGFRFSLAWWAYTFPLTGLSIATITYMDETTNLATRVLCLVLFSAATITVLILVITTIFHAFVLRDLFPNDIAIAISEKGPKKHKKRPHWNGTSNSKADEETIYIQSADSNDIEASMRSVVKL